MNNKYKTFFTKNMLPREIQIPMLSGELRMRNDCFCKM